MSYHQATPFPHVELALAPLGPSSDVLGRGACPRPSAATEPHLRIGGSH